MAIKRHKPEEIITKLRQVDVLRGQGSALGLRCFSFCLKHEISRDWYGVASRRQK